MNYEILDALSQITREKSVDRQLLVETLEAGLASAVRKKHGATAEVAVKFSNETGAITVALNKTVVETVDDSAIQMTLEEARAHKPNAQIGDVLTFPLSIAEFGRNAIQTAKQVLISGSARPSAIGCSRSIRTRSARWCGGSCSRSTAAT